MLSPPEEEKLLDRISSFTYWHRPRRCLPVSPCSWVPISAVAVAVAVDVVVVGAVAFEASPETEELPMLFALRSCFSPVRP